MSSKASPADLRIATMMAGIAVVLLAGILLGAVVRRARQPAVIGEILAGIILGPSVLGQLPGDLSHRIFPTDVRPLLNAVSQLGLVLFMFMIGWEFDEQLLRRQGRAAAAVSLSSVGVAFGFGVGIATVLYPHHSVVAGHHIAFSAFAMFMGAAMAVTAFPVLARILAENRLTHTRVGALALASAGVDDLIAWCLLAYVSALVTARGNGGVAQVLALSAGYVATMFLVVRPVLAALVARWVRSARWRSVLVLLCAGVFLSSWATTWIGIHPIFGAFLFGLIMPRAPAGLFAEHFREPLENVSVVLLPVFFIVTGLAVNIGGLHGREYLELVAIVGIACGGKLLGAVIPAKVWGLSWREAWVLGLLMNTRGLTEMIILNAAVTLGVLDGQMFTMMVIMALVTTALAGPLLPRDRAVLEQPTAGVPVQERPLEAVASRNPTGWRP